MIARNFLPSPSISLRGLNAALLPAAVDLATFSCTAIQRSSFIRRVCYDQKNSYMIVQLNETCYHYCDIDKSTVDAFNAARIYGAVL